jgi:uncharacterized protein YutE (UPF0331/DUF86 family)
VTNTDLVLKKAGIVRHRIERIRAVLATGKDRVVADEPLLEQLAFNAFLAMQDSVDIASHIVADEAWGVPDTLGGLFDVLCDHGVLDAATAEAMRRGTRLRNLIAHGYGVIDPAKLFDSMTAGVAEIEAYLDAITTWLDEHEGG